MQSDSAMSAFPCLESRNFIRLNIIAPECKGKYQVELRFQIAHELCRLLYNENRVSTTSTCVKPPVKLFLSHSRSDGRETAENFNSFISSKTSLKTFIDVNDIAPGSNFEDEITSNVQSSVLLVFYSDTYSSREWCQREMLLAKQKNCPIVLVDILRGGENRRFPYMTNVKVIHLSADHDYLEILTEVLLETLKIKYRQAYLDYVVETFGIDKNITTVFNCPPELYTLLFCLKNVNGKILVYPDPPLNVNETEILKKMCPDISFITPTYIPSIGVDNIQTNFLTRSKIGLSISESVDSNEYGLTNKHLRSAYIEICRHLLALGADLVYAGNLTYTPNNNFLILLKALVDNYSFNEPKNDRIICFELNNKEISKEIKAEYINTIKFVTIGNTEKRANDCDIQYMYDLLKLRNESNKDVLARIAIGGKIVGYHGRYPGILEEVYCALKSKIPVFLIGAFGGATKLIIKCLKGAKPEELTEVYQKQNNSGYDSRYYQFNASADPQNETIDYNAIVEYLNQQGMNSLRNGLTDVENEELFYGDDIMKSVYLIVKGLKGLMEKSK